MYEMVNCGVVKVFFTVGVTMVSVDGLQKLYDVYYPECTTGEEIKNILNKREIKTQSLSDEKEKQVECVELFEAIRAIQYLKKSKDFKATGCTMLLKMIYHEFERVVWNEAAKKTTQDILNKLNNQDEKEKTLMAVGRLLNDRRDKMIRQIEASVQTKE